MRAVTLLPPLARALARLLPGALALAVAAPAGAVEDTMAERMQACVPCHGPEGRAAGSAYFPRIAGKPAGYLENQLRNFREDRRRYPAMNHLVQHFSDGYVREIAAYFAALDLPYPPAARSTLSADEARRAEELVRRGAPARGIPGCTACHGDAMAGRLPAMPGLLALPADYLIAQLGAWRTGQRRAAPPDCMAEVARKLTPEEIGLVARWLGAATLPLGTKPAPAGPPLPIPCGSGTPP
jgi:cytochrome c553